MKNLFAALCALLVPFLASAQFSVSGKISDQQTGQTLPGATITIENTYSNAVADANGAYNFKNLKAGSYAIKVTYIGYNPAQKTITISAATTVNFELTANNVIGDEVTVRATRATANSATTFTNLSKKDLEKNNFGQDIPYLLNQTPSAVITSDGGTGIGYTGIRIRGSDASRTNVTLNGIPMNDSEDQGAYFIDLPDLVSSVDNIQVQRGIGTSTNGAGAFGASINMQTTTRHDAAYTQLDNSIGSYGAYKNTISVGTGLINDHFTFDGRLSRIESSGYIDRAASHLKSFFLSGAYYGKKTLVRANVFSGYEQTYQAWDGIPEDILKAGNRTYNELGLEADGKTYYPNQTDNYTQNYAQLLVDHQISSTLSFSGALHYTKGFGYYEEYKKDQTLANYGITPVVIGGVTVGTSSLVRQLWLNTDFYGLTYAFHYQPEKTLNFTLGGAYNEYLGAHYDNIQWTQQSTNVNPGYEYSRNNAKKTDFNIFGKIDYTISDITLFVDLQYRHIDYSFLGYDRNLKNVQQSAQLDFFNPKGGITYQLNTQSNVYASIAIANHEPNRNDFTNSTPDSRPKAEHMTDYELGYRLNTPVFKGGINGYYMKYSNQLVLTGKLNDVGEATRVNVDDSYRLGVEFDGKLKICDQLNWAATAALSTNKIDKYTVYYFNYDNNTNVPSNLSNTNIAYSPSFVGSSEISWLPFKGAEAAFVSKYVGMQYLDNTSNTNPVGVVGSDPNSNRTIDSYFVNNVRLRYGFQTKLVKNIAVSLLVYNIFSTKYITNGATYPDIESGQLVNYNYYFPQAPRNFFLSLSLGF
ncbi:TonB-dependent receptor [Mucilaginibacter sp. HMF5004]|uniref:TonB-dependent receptor n=1 Tax=Mucilaginibacter rivuli TaxID=2857527 RepID=UPI001C5F1226|nr:TonB-dependent receptor [Mucilaginibacter rivuli]MBW4890230.1 TonB-dependent receptor [Mucilaginibacter rivuli]